MIGRIGAVLVLGLAGVASAQLSGEQVAQRLAQLNAQAATRPAEDAERMRLVRENADLRRKVAELTEENAALEKRIEQIEQRVGAHAAASAPVSIAKGMTLADAESILGSKAVLLGADGDGETYTISQVVEHHQTNEMSATVGKRYTVRVHNGVIANFSMQPFTETRSFRRDFQP